MFNCCIKDLEDLRKQLEAEKKKNKDLASQIVKLNGIIKTGHDALTQEQNLTKKLQEQLTSGDVQQVNYSLSSFLSKYLLNDTQKSRYCEKLKTAYLVY